MNLSIRPHDIDPIDTGPETAVLMVIFPMHISRNGATKGDKFCSWRDHRKPAPGQERSDDITQ